MRSRLLTVILLMFLFLAPSCAARKHLIAPSTAPEASFQATDSFIGQAREFYMAGDYDKALELLRAIGQQEYSYYRMDEVLYLIGKCRYEIEDFPRAERAFSMLDRFYPRSTSTFGDLREMEHVVYEELSQHPEKRYADNPDIDKRSGFQDDHNSGNHNRENQPKVTNMFYETDIRQALADIAIQTGVSIVPDNFVSGYVTVEFSDTPLENALDQLLFPLGLAYRKMESYYLVGSPSPESPSFALLNETKRIHPRYISCEEARKLMPISYEKYLRLDPGSNSLTITAPSSLILKFREDLDRIDQPRTQIMIEAMVVEMSSEAIRSLGIDWDWINRDGEKTYRITKSIPTGFDSTFISAFTKVTSAFDLQVALKALASKGKAKIRANPRVATVDGHQAEIRIAKEAYFSLIQGSVNLPYFTLEKIPTGISLKITPYIGESSEITTDIVTEVSDVIGTGTSELPVTNVRIVNTRIRTLNGETIAIGGLVSERERKEENRVPYLGEIPVLGALFGHTTLVKEETEIIILISPHILINPMDFTML